MGSRPTDGIAGHASPLGPAGKLIRGRARHAETSAPKIKESRLESEAAHAASASALLVAGSRKFRGSQDAIGPPRRACCKSRNLAVLGMRRLFSSGYFFEQHSFSLPFEQQRSFPAAPFGVRRRVLRSTTPEEGEWSADRRTLSFFLSRVRGATPTLVRRGPVPVRPGPLSALHRGVFRPRTHAGVSGSGTRSRSDCPRQAVNALAVGVRASHGAVLAAVAGRHSWLRLQVVSGDVPS
jgi:hypothetical protein